MSNGEIVFESVSKSYTMGELEIPVLKDVNFKIPAGELCVVFGPSGSGKTTLLNLICGIDTPTTGRILIDGKDISAMKDTELTEYRKNSVGYIFQFYNLLPTLTAIENVAISLELQGVKDTGESQSMLEKVGLGKLSKRFPAQLSGGEQQRVAIARALVKRPLIVAGDEPTGNLDEHTAKDVLMLMRELNSQLKMTMLIASHDPSYEKIASTVIRIQNMTVSMKQKD